MLSTLILQRTMKRRCLASIILLGGTSAERKCPAKLLIPNRNSVPKNAPKRPGICLSLDQWSRGIRPALCHNFARLISNTNKNFISPPCFCRRRHSKLLVQVMVFVLSALALVGSFGRCLDLRPPLLPLLRQPTP